ncbi:hypothetical protein Y032_0117g701 [Ancylostoma ceylanicum]|uniref:Uncharacterized protein n=1 Tax=Ancylostoma ceylanicum TaxID=53326 RepID=A0A016TC98_9BILA|nr:hypothetical protein Y032_0117g701 [Ancylostoma ceylanicum]
MQLVLLSFAIVSLHRQADAVRGALVLKKSHQQSMDSDDNVEELEELEEEEGYKQSELDKASIYEQGETRDFLQFLRKIKYDHRQCPDDDNGARSRTVGSARRGDADWRRIDFPLCLCPRDPRRGSLPFYLATWSTSISFLYLTGPVSVNVSIVVSNVRSVSEVTMVPPRWCSRNTKKTHAQSVYLFEKDCTSQWHFH